MEQLYISRKSRGNNRVQYNDTIQKIPGLYNEKGRVEVQVINDVLPYDILNLTAAGRVQNLER